MDTGGGVGVIGRKVGGKMRGNKRRRRRREEEVGRRRGGGGRWVDEGR